MENQQIEEVKRTGSLLPVVIFLGLLFFPGMIFGFIFFVIFFLWLKWKPRVSMLLILVISLFLFGYYLIAKPFQHIFEFNNLSIYNYLNPYLFISFIFGILLATFLILWNARQLKMYPELTIMNGWAKDFKYKPTPLQVYLKKKYIKSIKTGEAGTPEKSPLGVLDDKVLISSNEQGEQKFFDKAQLVGRYYEEGFTHTLITGATGSGKTITMLSMLKNDIESNYPVCVVDFKKGQEWVYFLSKWAKEHNRKFYHFTSGKENEYNNIFCSHQATYDPLSTGTSTSKADMMLNMREWDSSSEVYKNRTKVILQSVFYLLDTVEKDKCDFIPWKEGGFAQLVSALKLNNFKALIEEHQSMLDKKRIEYGEISPDERRKQNSLDELYLELSNSKSRGLRDQVEELLTNCRTLILSSYGNWLAKGPSPNHINLFELSTSKNSPIILFQFNPQEESDFAKYMGSIIMSDLSRAASYKNKKQDKTPFGLYIDEFQTLNPLTVTDMIEKARSSKFFINLSLQSLEQIVKASPNNGIAVRDSITDTLGNFIIHQGAGYDTAETLSKIAGQVKKKVYKEGGKRNSSFLKLNMSSSRQAIISATIEDSWIVSPEDFQSLSKPVKENNYKTTAYYITKACSEPALATTGRAVVRRVQIIPNDEILEGVSDEFTINYNNPNLKKRKKKKTTKKDVVEKNVKNDLVDLNSQENTTINEQLNDDLDFLDNQIENELIHQETKKKIAKPVIQEVDYDFPEMETKKVTKIVKQEEVKKEVVTNNTSKKKVTTFQKMKQK